MSHLDMRTTMRSQIAKNSIWTHTLVYADAAMRRPNLLHSHSLTLTQVSSALLRRHSLLLRPRTRPSPYRRQGPPLLRAEMSPYQRYYAVAPAFKMIFYRMCAHRRLVLTRS